MIGREGKGRQARADTQGKKLATVEQVSQHFLHPGTFNVEIGKIRFH
jgi:hypothetical protein